MVRNMLDLPQTPPTNRSRSRHTVEKLLAPEIFSPSKHQPYVRKLGSDISFNETFKNGKYNGKYVIENLPADPEYLLRILIKRSIDEAMDEAEKVTGFKPDRIGTAITSVHLDKPIYTPFREPTEDTPESLLNRFLHVVQSRTSKGKGSVLGAPFEIRVDTTCVDALPKNQKIQGSGGGGQYHWKRNNQVHHNVCI
jgi:hypothetical protein